MPLQRLINVYNLVVSKTKQPAEFSPPLDKGIAPYVELLTERGIETFESCEGV